MLISRLFLVTAAASLCAALPAAGQTLTGHYDARSGFGYAAFDTAITVPADTGGIPSATFNHNTASGLDLFDATATVKGGQFNNNQQYGIQFTTSVGRSAGGTISGGIFDSNFVGADAENSSVVTITGGSFRSNVDYGISSYTSSAVTVTGGVFSGNALYDFETGFRATMDFFGSFLDPATRIPLTPGQTRLLTGSGTFQGTLASNLVPQTYTYQNFDGTMTLHDVLTAPEPSPAAAFIVGMMGIGALIQRKMRRRD